MTPFPWNAQQRKFTETEIRLVEVWLWEQGPDRTTPLTNVRKLGVTELSYTIVVTVTRAKVYTKLKVTRVICTMKCRLIRLKELASWRWKDVAMWWHLVKLGDKWQYLSCCLLESLQQAGLLLFWDRVLLCSIGWPGTPYIDQAGLKLRDSLAFAPRPQYKD